MARAVICRGCGKKEKMAGRVPPGAIPEGWATVSGSAYCVACSNDAPLLNLSQRMADSATSAVIEAVATDPGLRAAMDKARATETPGSPEFIRLVRVSVEAACANGAESLPGPIRALFNDVLACVSWLRVAAHVGSSGTSAPVAPAPTRGDTDPFAL